MSRSQKCEQCDERKIAALVEIDGNAKYFCRICTEAVQEQHPTESLCEQCHEGRTINTLVVDNKPLTLCETCLKEMDDGKSKKKDKKAKKDKSSKRPSEGAGPGYGIGEQQGRRPTMEDAETAIPDLSVEFGDYCATPSAFYGVYDGHGGQRAAEFVKNTLHHKIIATDKFKNDDIEGAIKDGYLNTDNELLKMCDAEDWTDGCTAVVGLIHKGKLWTSCVGDSELVVSVDGVAQCRSFKHKPTDPGERARIQAAGGVVLFDRLGASMAVSRSFGDKVHKNPFNGAPADHMSCDPFIDSMDIDGVEFIIIACDGLWDTVEYQQAVDFVAKKRKKGKSPSETAEAIVQEALDRGSNDNVTAIIVYL